MLRRWAHGLLAFLVCLTLLHGGALHAWAGSKLSVSADAQRMQSSGMELQLGVLASPKAVEAAPSRLQQVAKRDNRLGGGTGDDTAALLVFLAVAILLFPRPMRIAPFRIRSIPVPARSRPQAAGRCPTGPPVAA